MNNEVIPSPNQENELLRDEIIRLRSQLAESNFKANYLKNLLEDEQFKNQQLNHKLENLEKLRKEYNHNCQKIIAEFQVKISKLEAESFQASEQFNQLQNLLFEANERILAMETSKFWKMRKGWFFIRKVLGISGE